VRSFGNPGCCGWDTRAPGAMSRCGLALISRFFQRAASFRFGRMAFYRRWLLVLFALILSGGSLFAASTKEQRAYNAAKADFRIELWSRADAEFGQFVQKYPKSTNAPEAVLLQAQAEFKQGDLANAIAKLTNPDNLAKAGTLADQYVYWTGEAQFQNAGLTNAAETFVSLAQNFPNSPLRLRAVVEAAAAYTQLTNWLRHDALLENTNGVFQRAAQLDPGNALVADGWLSLENSKYQQRDFPGVVAIYDSLTNQWQTLNQSQQCQGAYLYYLAKMELGDFAAALAAATNLVQIAGTPANQEWLATARASQGKALEKLSWRDEAIAAYGENLTTNAPVTQRREAILKIAELEIVQGQLTNAEEALANFLAQFPEAISADIALLTAGELQLKEYAARPAETNHLQAASAAFNRFLGVFTNSPLAGKAYLDRGWCEWLAGNATNSLNDFTAAAQSASLPPEDLAVARFKSGDAMFALTNYAGALENYRAVLDDFTNVPAVAAALGDRALYQSLRASLQLTNYDGASNALAQILGRFPASNLATNAMLLYGEGQVAATNEPAARAVFRQFLAQFPGSQLRPEVEFAIARTYELDQSWPDAIAGYKDWLDHFPTNQDRARTIYSLARANTQAGNESDAFGLFTNLVTEFPTSDLAPQAQWWVADHFFRLGGANSTNYVDAERNYKMLFQNTNWQGSPLVDRARMMAGRAAVAARQDYKGAIDYFNKLEGDTNCPMDLRVQAAFAHGSALMREESSDTNYPLANFTPAVQVFRQIGAWDPTNALLPMANIEIGKCYLQLTNFDAATNSYAQVVNATNASVAARSQAQIGIGIVLEKMAALASGPAQNELLNQALNDYLDVFDKLNLRDGEEPDPFWQKEAGLRAAPLVGRLNDLKAERKFYGSLKDALPQLSNLIDQKLAALPPEKN
jgi:outer membrane protein assembly factor BamD (BamD/ComL family)